MSGSSPHSSGLSAVVPGDWLIPDWPAPAGVHALCTARSGGMSTGPYASFNLGDHVGDDPAAVAGNRARLTHVLQSVTPGARPVFLKQVHGDGVLHVVPDTADGTEADACVTTAAGVACTIMVADCLPVLLAHRSGGVVAAAHAGWRGLVGTGGRGVLEAAFERFSAQALDGSAGDAIDNAASGGSAAVVHHPFDGANAARTAVAAETLAWLGPCIGPTAFEVGEEVREAFCSTRPASAACFVPRVGHPGKYLCNLPGLARQALQALGISRIYGNDGGPAWCTVDNVSRFFSHRHGGVTAGGSGRFAVCIWRG